jgi:beta-alanine degradation protein BauB
MGKMKEACVVKKLGGFMLLRKKSLFVSILFLFLVFGSSITFSQDPAVVNSKFITVKLDNNKVRVFEAVLKPGDKEEMHSHPASVMYIISGGTGLNHTPDGKTNEMVLKTGDVIYREPTTHWAENTGSTTIHLVLVELKNAE